MMVVLISRSGYCTITLRYDKASIADPELLARCLLAGFDEVLALGGDGRADPCHIRREQELGFSRPAQQDGSAAQ